MNIGLIIYLLGYVCGMAFGIAVSMLVDFLTSDEDLRTLGEDYEDDENS